jgi:hypothetical protein
MADPSRLADLLDLSHNVFLLADQLSQLFEHEHQRLGERRQVGPSAWHRLKLTVDKYCSAVLELRYAILQDPLVRIANVAKYLKEATLLAKQIRDMIRTTDVSTRQNLLGLRPELYTLAKNGRKAVVNARRLADPFVFVDEPAEPPRQISQRKRSTEPGEGRAKLVAALTKHHRYGNGGCLNQEPINNNELARQAGVDKATASVFFKKEFGSHAKYRSLCQHAGLLAPSLKLLNGEYTPGELFGGKLPGEDDRDDHE